MNTQPSDIKDEDFLKKIMLVVDGSPSSVSAAKYAVRLAHKLQCALVAVYVVDTATMDYLLQMHIFVSEEREDFEASLEAKGKGYLQRISQVATACGINVETRILRGAFHKQVASCARGCGAEAIVIGGWRKEARGKDTFSEERELVMATAECPVLVVNQPIVHQV